MEAKGYLLAREFLPPEPELVAVPNAFRMIQCCLRADHIQYTAHSVHCCLG